MKLRYTIEDLNAVDYVVDFEFHRELDGQLVFDAGWDIVEISEELAMPAIADQAIQAWLSNGGEDLIYIAAQRELV